MRPGRPAPLLAPAMAMSTLVTLASLVGLAATSALAANRKLAWDPNVEMDLAGYKVYFGTASRGCHDDPVAEDFIYGGGAADQGGAPIVVFLEELADPANPTYVLVNVPDDVDSFAVTAFNTAGEESRYSNEVQLGADGPFLCAASADTSTSIRVDYNEFVDQATATNPLNYVLRDSADAAVDIASIDYDFATFRHVTLHPAAALVEGETYTLTVNGVQDYFDGAVIAANTQTVVHYTNGPNLRRAGPLNNGPPQVEIEFSEPVDSTAGNAGNYSIDGGVFVSFAQKAIERNFSDHHRDVNLTTSALTEGVSYTVTVSNVQDDFGNPIAPGSMIAFTVPVDVTAPSPLSSHVTAPPLRDDEVHVVFDEEVDAGTATTLSNYAISGGIAIFSAALQGDNKTVVLATAPHPDGNYLMSIAGVADASVAMNVMAPAVLPYRVVDAITDSDGDTREDVRDNCTTIDNLDQRDTDGDKYGNPCDADLNNDGVVNFLDLGIMRSVFFTADANADLDGDGVVNFLDLGRLRSRFFQAPGPSGTAPP